MTYEETETATITANKVLAELKAHSIHGSLRPNGDIEADGETVVHPQRNGLYLARSVLDWLGY